MLDEMRRTLSILLFLLAASDCLADGKLYARERVPPDIPYQRALILFQDRKETLVLQSKFESDSGASTNAPLGWVIPVPAVPELATMTAYEAQGLFFDIGIASGPKVTHVRMVCAAVLLGIIAASVLVLFLCLLSSFLPVLKYLRTRRGVFASFAVYGIVFSIVAALSITTFGTARGWSGVDILKAEQVGIYDAKVIKSKSSADLIHWLNENGFEFTASDTPVLDSYVHADWCFVVAKVRPEEKNKVAAVDGLIDPLILRFGCAEPVYPLALTSTVGVNTELLIYLLSDRKMECGGRLKLHFAGEFEAERLRYSRGRETDLFAAWETDLTYLCKFKGNLTPEQMQKDLHFTSAPDNEPYRERIVRW